MKDVAAHAAMEDAVNGIVVAWDRMKTLVRWRAYLEFDPALAKAAEAYPGAGGIERPESWLFRIAHNTALDALRRRKRQATVRFEIDLSVIADPGAVADARVAA